MYITVILPSEGKITSYALEQPINLDDNELALTIIEALGYHLDEIYYMLTSEEPYISSNEIGDVLPNFKIITDDNK